MACERVAFIPAWLDDFGLSASVFRIYCHISRRGQCYDAIPMIARVCRLNANTVKKGLRELVERKLVAKLQRSGKTTIYRVTTGVSPRTVEVLGLESTQVSSGPRLDEGLPRRARNSPRVGQKETYEGSPIKGTQKRNNKGASPSTSHNFRSDAEEVLKYLNDRAGRTFRMVDSHLQRIARRLSERGITVQGLKELIDSKVREWKGDSKMERHLCPETLFGREKFHRYYDDRNIDCGGPISAANLCSDEDLAIYAQ